jgi:hypothetical protein
LSPRWSNRPFNTAQAAEAALDAPSTGLDPVFGEAVIEIEFHVPSGADPLRIKGGMQPLVLPATVDFDTHIARYALGEQALNIVQIGQLDRFVTLPGPIWFSMVRQALIGVAVALALLALVAIGVLRRRRMQSGPMRDTGHQAN